jgi:hypothetical protein
MKMCVEYLEFAMYKDYQCQTIFEHICHLFWKQISQTKLQQLMIYQYDFSRFLQFSVICNCYMQNAAVVCHT